MGRKSALVSVWLWRKEREDTMAEIILAMGLSKREY